MSLKMLKRLTKTIKTTRWTVKNADRNSFCWTIQRYCEALEEFVLRGRFKKKKIQTALWGILQMPFAARYKEGVSGPDNCESTRLKNCW